MTHIENRLKEIIENNQPMPVTYSGNGGFFQMIEGSLSVQTAKRKAAECLLTHRANQKVIKQRPDLWGVLPSFRAPLLDDAAEWRREAMRRAA